MTLLPLAALRPVLASVGAVAANDSPESLAFRAFALLGVVGEVLDVRLTLAQLDRAGFTPSEVQAAVLRCTGKRCALRSGSRGWRFLSPSLVGER